MFQNTFDTLLHFCCMKLQQKSLFLSFCSWLVSVSHLVLSKLLCLQHLLSSVNFVYGQNQLHLKKNILVSPRSFYKNLLLCKFHSRLFVFRRQQSHFSCSIAPINISVQHMVQVFEPAQTKCASFCVCFTVNEDFSFSQFMQRLQ